MEPRLALRVEVLGAGRVHAALLYEGRAGPTATVSSCTLTWCSHILHSVFQEVLFTNTNTVLEQVLQPARRAGASASLSAFLTLMGAAATRRFYRCCRHGCAMGALRRSIQFPAPSRVSVQPCCELRALTAYSPALLCFAWDAAPTRGELGGPVPEITSRLRFPGLTKLL